MPVSVLMPALSPTMTEGKLAKWLKSEGDEVVAGDVIAEIETDKATMEVEAVDEGVLAKILVAEGTDAVPVNQMIAVLLEEDEEESALEGFTGDAPKAKAAPQATKAEAPAEAKTAPSQAPTDEKPQNKTAERLFATPLARRIAAGQGLDLSNIQGSGPNGRIVKADVEGATTKTANVPQAATALQGGDSIVEEVPHNGMRKVIAKRLSESKQTVPHFYLTVDCQLDSMLAARQRINDAANGDYKVSINDFIIKAVAMALKAFPAANVAWSDDAMLQYKTSDISVAVATPDGGLITPIVRAAETKGLKEISTEVKELAGRAKEGKLQPNEYQGGSFSISNLGMYGIEEFTAIINPPQACIMAVGAGIRKPYADGDEVKIGTFMRCTLSVDHRAVDGAIGAGFLAVFKRYIENPVEMIV